MLKDIFSHSTLVKQAFRVLERMFNVMKKNQHLVDAVVAAQDSTDGKKGLTFKWWGDTRWNSKVDSMERLLVLVPAVNFVLSSQPPQTASYFINAEEVRALKLTIPFLKPLCLATDELQKDSSTLVDLHRVYTGLEKHLDEHATLIVPVASQPGQCLCLTFIDNQLWRHGRVWTDTRGCNQRCSFSRAFRSQ